MIRFACDKCGASLGANDSGRFIIKIEAYAASGPLVFSSEDIEQDRSHELSSLIEELSTANPDDIEDQTYRNLRFDLCGPCHKKFLIQPLG